MEPELLDDPLLSVGELKDMKDHSHKLYKYTNASTYLLGFILVLLVALLTCVCSVGQSLAKRSREKSERLKAVMTVVQAQHSKELQDLKDQHALELKNMHARHLQELQTLRATKNDLLKKQ